MTPNKENIAPEGDTRPVKDMEGLASQKPEHVVRSDSARAVIPHEAALSLEAARTLCAKLASESDMTTQRLAELEESVGA